jgi:hypothetical protein
VLSFRSGFFGSCEKRSQAVQALLGCRPPIGDPLCERGEAPGLDPASAHPPDLFASDKPACLQRLKMLEHGSEGHSEWRGQVADRGRAAAQPLQASEDSDIAR